MTPHAHRPTDKPAVSREDVVALLWLIVFAALFVAITAIAQ